MRIRQELLELAKRAVEVAIESGEDAALALLVRGGRKGGRKPFKTQYSLEREGRTLYTINE